MNEYYAAPTTQMDSYLAHYGIPGMRWGVRKNPQKAFYKQMKRDMKDALRQNRAANSRVASGSKTIGARLSRNDIDRYSRVSDRIEKAHSANERFEERLTRDRQRAMSGKIKISDAQASKNLAQMLRNEKNLDRAYDNYRKELSEIRERMLGKYAKKKIRMDSSHSRIKRDAGYVLESALRSQMKPKNSNPVQLSKRQRELESKWKEATGRMDNARGSKAYQEASAANTKAAGEFLDSLSEKQKKRYHDRYLY